MNLCSYRTNKDKHNDWRLLVDVKSCRRCIRIIHTENFYSILFSLCRVWRCMAMFICVYTCTYYVQTHVDSLNLKTKPALFVDCGQTLRGSSRVIYLYCGQNSTELTQVQARDGSWCKRCISHIAIARHLTEDKQGRLGYPKILLNIYWDEHWMKSPTLFST